MPGHSSEPIRSLYVHVPFCAQKCSYCAFYSEASSGELINAYVEALIREMELVAADCHAETIFFGGGTPSLLNLRQWEKIFAAMQRLNLLGASEWTIECNPATVSADKAKLLRSFGVNRISMGVQSLDEDLLERLGRVHTCEMVFKSFDILRKAGFENINVDLMFAIPGQTLELWRRTLGEALAMESEHLSSYEVIYEEDTALFAQLQAGEFAVDEDLACAMYDLLLEKAAAASLVQYEVANFAWNSAEQINVSGPQAKALAKALPGSAGVSPAQLHCVSSDALGTVSRWDAGAPREKALPSRACRHNVNYWRGDSFHGLGPSATSYVRGVRSKNVSNTKSYCQQLSAGKRPIESREQLPALSRAGETAAFGLRMPIGWSFDEFHRTTGFDLRQEWACDLAELTRLGWANLSPHRFHLTRKGLRFADAAAERFLR